MSCYNFSNKSYCIHNCEKKFTNNDYAEYVMMASGCLKKDILTSDLNLLTSERLMRSVNKVVDIQSQ